mgnify:CR=1 FL=1
MAKNTIILIEPIGGMNFTPELSKRGNQAPPYAIEVLGGYLQEKGGYDVKLIHQRPIKSEHIREELAGTDEGKMPTNISDEDIVEMIGQIGENEIIMVGLSAITPLFNRSLQISKKIKERFPEIKIVIGGYHPSAVKEKIYLSNKYNEWEGNLQKKVSNKEIRLVDFFTAGEGEQTILDLVDAIKEGNEGRFSEIEGVIFRSKEGEINKFKQRKRFLDAELAELPEARRKILAPIKNEVGKVIGIKEIPSSVDCTQFGTFPGYEEIRGEIQIQTTRGCPGNCSFCSSPIVWGEETEGGQGDRKFISPVRFRDPKKLISEIEKYHNDPEYKTNYIYFADLTFNENLGYVKKLCEEMIESGIFGGENENNIHWFCLAKAFDASSKEKEGVAKEVIGLMKKAGCSKIGIGIEGFSPNDIAELKRPSGQKDSQEKYQEGIKKFTNAVWSLKKTSEAGMFTRGYFVWGRENHNEFSEARARALLGLSIPKELFGDYEKLREAVEFIFEKQDEFAIEGEIKRPLTAKEISELVAKNFNLENSSKARFLEIDHLRIAPETPYPETSLSRTAKLKYYDIEKGEDGVLLRDDKGELVKKIGLDGKPVIVDHNKTLQELINEGWDDFDVLDQERATIKCEADLDEITNSQKRITSEFYLSEGYTESVREKIKRFPHLVEAYKSWAAFLKEAKLPIEEEKWLESHREQLREKTGEIKIK